MGPRPPVQRWFAGLLALGLALPAPALALRPEPDRGGLEEVLSPSPTVHPEPSRKTGLEEPRVPPLYHTLTIAFPFRYDAVGTLLGLHPVDQTLLLGFFASNPDAPSDLSLSRPPDLKGTGYRAFDFMWRGFAALSARSGARVTIPPAIDAALRDPQHSLEDLLFSPDGRTLYLLSNPTPTFEHVPSSQRSGKGWIGGQMPYTKVRVVYGYTIRAFDWASGALLEPTVTVKHVMGDTLAINPDGTRLYVLTRALTKEDRWTRYAAHGLDTATFRRGDRRRLLVADGRSLPALYRAAASVAKPIRRWAAARRHMILTFPSSPESPTFLLPNPDGRRLHVVFNGIPHTARTYDLTTGQWEARIVPLDFPAAPSSFTLSADGRTLLEGTMGRSGRVGDLADETSYLHAYALDGPLRQASATIPSLPSSLFTDAQGILTVISSTMTPNHKVSGLRIARSVPPERGVTTIEWPSPPGISGPPAKLPTAGLEEVKVMPIAEVLRHADPTVADALLTRQATGPTEIVLVPREAAPTRIPSRTLFVDAALTEWARRLVPQISLEPLDGSDYLARTKRLQRSTEADFWWISYQTVFLLDAARPRPALPPQHPLILLFDPATVERVDRAAVLTLLAQGRQLRGRIVDLSRGPLGTVLLDGVEYAIYA